LLHAPSYPRGVQRTPSPQWQGVAVLAGAPPSKSQGARGNQPLYYPRRVPGGRYNRRRD
jgi:hypothetical protein